jgi:hypothetical protein
MFFCRSSIALIFVRAVNKEHNYYSRFEAINQVTKLVIWMISAGELGCKITVLTGLLGI